MKRREERVGFESVEREDERAADLILEKEMKNWVLIEFNAITHTPFTLSLTHLARYVANEILTIQHIISCILLPQLLLVYVLLFVRLLIQ